VSDQGGGQAAWKGDEREIYYRSGAAAMMVASVKTEPQLSVGKPSVLFKGDFANIQGKNYDVTPDGRRFLMIRVDDRVPPADITVVLNWLDDLKHRVLSK
jgi:hypothetical protein